MTENVTVLGTGGFGTAIALVLHANRHRVRIWGNRPEFVAEVASRRQNARYLPGVAIPEGIELVADPMAAVAGATLAVCAVPTQYIRPVMGRFRGAFDRAVPVVSLAKGVENETLERPSEVLRDVLGADEVAVLTGPSHAEEVARRLPTTVVAAAGDGALAGRVQRTFSGGNFRVYTSDDVVGCEIGGALKNIVAIAAGIIDGCGFGDNAKAALLTRGLVEIARLGTALGGRRETFWGLSGMGDLVTTCVSPHGRNRAVGEKIGKGKKLSEILAGTSMVAEGVRTTQSVAALAARLGIDMPITQQVHEVLFADKDPRQALRDLMGREVRAETDEMRR